MAWFVCPQRDYNHWVRKELALNASPMPPAWQLPELASSRSGVQGNLRFAGTVARGKQLPFSPIALNAASWIRYSQHGGGPTSLSYFPWHSCLLNPPFGVPNPQLTTSEGYHYLLEWGGDQSTEHLIEFKAARDWSEKATVNSRKKATYTKGWPNKPTFLLCTYIIMHIHFVWKTWKAGRHFYFESQEGKTAQQCRLASINCATEESVSKGVSWMAYFTGPSALR